MTGRLGAAVAPKEIVFVASLPKTRSGKILRRLLKARELGLAGATVWRGIEGYGARSRIHAAKILRLSEDLPLVIEVVDEEEKIRRALPELDALMEASGGGGLVTLEKAEIIKYTRGRD